MKVFVRKNYIPILILVFLLATFGCREVTKSSSMALDNANSVIKSGSEHLWNDPEHKKENKEYSEDKHY
jgi:hypothetical protein